MASDGGMAANACMDALSCVEVACTDAREAWLAACDTSTSSDACAYLGPSEFYSCVAEQCPAADAADAPPAIEAFVECTRNPHSMDCDLAMAECREWDGPPLPRG